MNLNILCYFFRCINYYSYYFFKYPGKPKATDIKSDSIRLFWNKSVKQADHYQIRFKTKDGYIKWKITETDSDENNIMITGLMTNKNYLFQVRGIFGDQEGPYGPVSEDICTTKSLATTLLDFSVLQRNTECPPIYFLPVEENKSARSTTARIRMLTLGKLKTIVIIRQVYKFEKKNFHKVQKIIHILLNIYRETYVIRL